MLAQSARGNRVDRTGLATSISLRDCSISIALTYRTDRLHRRFTDCAIIAACRPAPFSGMMSAFLWLALALAGRHFSSFRLLNARATLFFMQRRARVRRLVTPSPDQVPRVGQL